MFETIKTLVAGANARAEEQMRDRYCIELIDQKIREAEASLKSAKYGLAALIQRQRAEAKQISTLEARRDDLMGRARAALEAGREDLARDAAQAIAEMENELDLRRQTLDRLDGRVLQLRQSVEAAHRRIVDLKQGAVAARAAKREADIQKRLGAHVARDTAFEEADALIQRVLNRDDPFEQTQILREIDNGLTNQNAADRMAEAGFGPATKHSAADVLARLKSET